MKNKHSFSVNKRSFSVNKRGFSLNEKILAIIPARSGSKGISKKNIRNFCGIPLLAYPIEVAKKSGVFDRIIVDTDSEEIAFIGKKFGAEVPYLRPKQLAGDKSVVIDAVLLLLQRLKADGYEPNIISLLQTTSPLREAEDIINCYNLLNREPRPKGRGSLIFAQDSLHPRDESRGFFAHNKGVDSVVTVCESHPRFYHLEGDGKLVLVNKETENIINRQQVPMGYILNGCIVYIIKTEAFLKKKLFIYYGTYGVVCPKWRSVDLDNIEDWVQAEILYKNKELIKRNIESFNRL